MARKSISKTKINKIRSLLLEGKTSNEVAALLKISAPTVSNYRSYFKKQGDQFPNNRGRKPRVDAAAAQSSETTVPKTVKGVKYNDYTYVIDGTAVSFSSKPKTLLISKKRMLIEF